MKNLLIIGTGGFARETYWHANNAIGYGSEFVIKGFIEGDVPLNDKKYGLLPMPVINNIINYEIKKDDVFVIAIADCKIKEKIVEIVKNKNGKFMKLIHKTALIAPSAEIGEGVILCQNTSVSCNTKIGNFVMLNSYTSIGHDAKLGDYCSLMGRVSITGNVEVKDHVYFGCGAKVLPNAKVGAYAKVGAGSVVLKKVKEGETVFGVPAMPI